VGSIPVANPSPPRRLRFSRRALILGVAFLSVVGGLIVLVAFSWPENPAPPRDEWVDVGQASSVPVDEPVHNQEYMLYLVRTPADEILALSRRSTHLGCTVVWRPDREFNDSKGWFGDPCGGALWTLGGVRAFGPAARDMDRYPVAIVNGEVIVDVRNRLCGPGSEPTSPLLSCLPPDEYRGQPPLQ